MELSKTAPRDEVSRKRKPILDQIKKSACANQSIKWSDNETSYPLLPKKEFFIATRINDERPTGGTDALRQ